MTSDCRCEECGCYLARRNPASVCWQHGGWDGVPFVEAMRRFGRALIERERVTRLETESAARRVAQQDAEQRVPKLTIADRHARDVRQERAA